MIDIRKWDRVGDSDSTLLFPTDVDRRRAFVQPDTKTFEFTFYDLLVAQRLENIENDEDQVTGSCDYTLF